MLRLESGQTDDTAVIRRRRLKLYVATSVRLEFTVCQRNSIPLCRIRLRLQRGFTYGLYTRHDGTAEAVFPEIALLHPLDIELQDIIRGVAAEDEAVALGLIGPARHLISDHRTVYIIAVGRLTLHHYPDSACGTNFRLHHLCPSALFRIQIQDILFLQIAALQLLLRNQIFDAEILSGCVGSEHDLHMVIVLRQQRTNHIVLP